MKTYTVCVQLSHDEWRTLSQLCGEPPLAAIAENVPQLVEHLVQSALAGVERPGSWERGWLSQATGWPYY